jgi:hypothetical protein
MQTLTIEAASLESAQGLHYALMGFEPELIEAGNVYRVKLTLGRGDRATVEALNAIERHVIHRGDAHARIEMNGMNYTLHPRLNGTA